MTKSARQVIDESIEHGFTSSRIILSEMVDQVRCSYEEAVKIMENYRNDMIVKADILSDTTQRKLK